MNWDADRIPDQSGRTVLVTGANSGLGFETSRALAAANAHVVLACRSLDRGRDALDRIRDETPDASLELLDLDLADLASVRSFAERFGRRHDDLDVLVNNAGIMAIPRRETADGFEMQFGVNHLGHFALTGLLLDPLLAAEDARVVTVSSTAHTGGKMRFGDLHGETDYGPWSAYSQSKLANLLFAYELQRRFEATDADASSVAAHPGYSATELQARGPEMRGSRLRKLAMGLLNRIVAQDAEQGALPQLYAATAPDVVGGAYYGPDGFMEMRGGPTRVESTDRSHDRDAARRLWEYSENATDVSFELVPTEQD
ncbi:oxidoreductase [Halomarina oriensis]|uniref:SDR family NAD(P)-dependent oxidoreductase n=1 Tax=Halomarina oriensis TaxID=671145 RepID=A0A6B0GHH8_9EURY|nr:oxidoreductase [Halomarina oriensis]MWG34322.1 SDR family NAD(P)-dependent oxidoreductase [Halomarina oriensis]